MASPSQDLMLQITAEGYERAGLPPLNSLKDPWFIFGENHHSVLAKIESIGYGPNEGVKIYSTMRRYRGIQVDHLRFISRENGSRWAAVPTQLQLLEKPLVSPKEGWLVFV